VVLRHLSVLLVGGLSIWALRGGTAAGVAAGAREGWMTSGDGAPDADDQTAPAPWRRASRRLRLGYRWHFAAVGAFMPLAALSYRELGLSGLVVGILTALPACALALCAPLWGAVSDSLALHRLVLRVVLGLAVLVVLVATDASTFTAILLLVLLIVA
jgi:nitrate/nitrite transporter NarK